MGTASSLGLTARNIVGSGKTESNTGAGRILQQRGSDAKESGTTGEESNGSFEGKFNNPDSLVTSLPLNRPDLSFFTFVV
jgi:hypothetical protein